MQAIRIILKKPLERRFYSKEYRKGFFCNLGYLKYILKREA
jgi:hypothetical protein